jgi:hypothetical protein
MKSSGGKSKVKVPGFALLDECMQVYGRAWEKYAQTVGQAWEDVTCSDATVSTWTSSYSKVLQTMSDNARDLWSFYGTRGPGTSSSGCPTLVFVIDLVAQASARPQSLALPGHVDPARIHCTDLIRIGVPPVDGATSLAGHVEFSCDHKSNSLSVSIVELGKLPAADKQGQYTAVIYEAMGHPPHPPPQTAIAVVVLTFSTP